MLPSWSLCFCDFPQSSIEQLMLFLALIMQKKDHPFGICRSVFNFFMNSLFARGLKRATLGHVEAEVPLVDPLMGNGKDSVGEQQSTSIATTRSSYGYGYDIQVHFKQGEEELERWTSTGKPVSSGHEAQKGNQPKLEKTRATELPGNKELALVQAKGDATGQGKSPREAAARGMMEHNLKTLVGRRGSKSAANVKDRAAEEDGAKEDRRIARGKLKLANEPEEIKVKHPRHLFRVASNINEKSGHFIESRKEAMRRDMSLERKRP